MFFFEKKNQKTFLLGLFGLLAYAPKEQKSFASFLQKRRPFCCLPSNAARDLEATSSFT